MSCKNTFKSGVFLFLTFLGLLFLFTPFSHAQYNPSFYRGYLSYPYSGYKGSYGMPGIYTGLGGNMIPSPLIGGLGSISSELGFVGTSARLGILDPYLTMDGLDAMFGRLRSVKVMSGVGLLNPSMSTGVLGIWSPYGMTSGMSGIYGYMYGPQMMGSLSSLGGLGPAALGSLGGFADSTEILGLAGPGSLAGLVCLGSRAGLITSAATGLTTSLGF